MEEELNMDSNIVKGLRNGEIVVIGNKMYGMCKDCGSIVCLNKFLIGALHFCD